MDIRNQVLKFIGATEPILRDRGVQGRIHMARRGVRHCTIDVILSDPTTLPKLLHKDTIEILALACRTPSVTVARINGIVRLSYTLPENLWVLCPFSGTRGLGIGFGESKEQIKYDLTAPHTLIAGTTGSGKTEMSKAIALATIREFSKLKDEVLFVILDPNGKFEAFHDASCLATPIARVDSEFSAALKFASSEFLRRRDGRLLQEPRLMVFIDEAETILQGNDLKRVQDLTSGGREFGISCIVISQKPTEKSLPRILPNLGQRFVGAVTSPRISSDLTGHPGLRCHKLMGNGDFIKVLASRIERFQVSMPTPQDYHMISRGESSLWKDIEDEDEDEDTKGGDSFANQPGRPAREADPKVFAEYLIRGPHEITFKHAQEVLGISHAAHQWYKSFVAETLSEAMLLRKEIDQWE